jgi:hypothetical protein
MMVRFGNHQCQGKNKKKCCLTTYQIIPDSFLNTHHPFAASDLDKERVVEREAQLFLKKTV